MDNGNSTPRPAFPRWLRRIDPLLAAEDTNTLYQAFRERRQRRSWMARIADARSEFMIVGFATGGLVLLVYVLARFGCLACLAALVPIIAFLAIASATRHRRIQSRRLPNSVSGVFSLRGFHEQAAIDLWLTGSGGREIVEAIYLEQRQANWPVGMLYNLGIALLLTGLLMRHPYAGTIWYFPRLVFIFSFLCFAVTMAGLSIVTGMAMVRDYCIEPIVMAWKADSQFLRSISSGVSSYVRQATSIALSVFVLPVTFGILVLMISPNRDSPERPDPVGWLMAALIMFAITYLFGLFIRTSRSVYAAAFTSTADEAALQFEHFMRRRVMKDSDADRPFYYFRPHGRVAAP